MPRAHLEHRPLKARMALDDLESELGVAHRRPAPDPPEVTSSRAV